MPSTTRVAVMAGALVYSIGLAACNKKDQGTVVDTTASGTQTATVSVDTTPLKVSDIQVGKAVGTDNKISNSTTTFSARDTMYISVITDGAAKDAKIATKGRFALQVHAGGPMEVRFRNFKLEINPKFELKTLK